MPPKRLALVSLLALPAILTAQLTTDDNALWQQGFNGVTDGPENNDNFGFALAAGDFDGDGFEDAAIGAPGEDSARGAVHVLFGAAEGLTSVDSQIWKPGADPFPGNWESGDQSGSALAAGDFNGDGFADLAIGTPGEDNFQGAVNLLYGSQGAGLTLNGVFGFNQNSLEGDGPDNGDGFGLALAAGDFNGDGRDDLAVGSPGENNSGGLVHALYGSFGGLTTNGNQRWRQGRDGIPGDRENGDLFGRALATGDTNGDGFDDLIVGVPGEDTARGRVQVIFGSSGGLTGGGNQLWEQGRDGLPDDDDTGDIFGIFVETGDFNGDGYDDIAASATGEDGNEGNVIIIPGSPTGPTATGSKRLRQEDDDLGDNRENNDRFGSSLASGDFNLDGFDDLAIGVSGEDNNRGITHVLYGAANGLSGDGNQIFAQGWQGMQGDARTGDLFGFIMTAGDFGGDFATDLLIGSPGDDDGGSWGIAQDLLGNQKPQINAIVSGGLGLPSITTLSPNTIATTFGTDLFSSDNGRGVGPGDLDNGALPGLFARTCLFADGDPSPLLFLRDDQVNFQVRSDASGQVQFQLVRNCGEAYPLESNVFTVPMAAVSPDFFNFEVDIDNQSTVVAATKHGSGINVGPARLGAGFEPTTAGEIIQIWVTGLGLTNPPFLAGQLPPNDASGAAPAVPVTVLIDGVPATVLYAGTAPGFAGLYQINVVVPVTPTTGEVTISVTSTGGGPVSTTPPTAFIAVN